jgi:hypothetical protein
MCELTVEPKTMTVKRSGSTRVHVKIRRVNFEGDVEVRVFSAIASGSTTLYGKQTEGTLPIRAGSASPGSHEITIGALWMVDGSNRLDESPDVKAILHVK